MPTRQQQGDPYNHSRERRCEELFCRNYVWYCSSNSSRSAQLKCLQETVFQKKKKFAKYEIAVLPQVEQISITFSQLCEAHDDVLVVLLTLLLLPSHIPRVLHPPPPLFSISRVPITWPFIIRHCCCFVVGLLVSIRVYGIYCNCSGPCHPAAPACEILKRPPCIHFAS